MLKDRTRRSLAVWVSCCPCEQPRDPPGEQKPGRGAFTSQKLLKDGTIILCPSLFVSRKARALRGSHPFNSVTPFPQGWTRQTKQSPVIAAADGSRQWLPAQTQPETFIQFLSLPRARAYSFQSPRYLFFPLPSTSPETEKAKSQLPVKGPSLPNLERSQSGERPLAFFTCATLSQKGGLEVISALLSFRAPWQHSHQDINMHTQKFAAGVCARTHTQANREKHFKARGADMARKAKDFWKFWEEAGKKKTS